MKFQNPSATQWPGTPRQKSMHPSPGIFRRSVYANEARSVIKLTNSDLKIKYTEPAVLLDRS